jgi:superfamily II DNA or RNA helicase
MQDERADRVTAIKARLDQLEQERQQLLSELLQIQNVPRIPPPQPSTSEARIALFYQLFCCRLDVFPKLWENARSGIKGYSPACKNEWVRGVCGKSAGASEKRIRCAECSSRDFLPLDEAITRQHLEGKITVGTYAIRVDDTCIFLAADFDETTWQQDIIAYRDAGKEMGVDIAIERSRSGNGGHAWIFFRDPIPARDARILGTLILTRAITHRHTINLKSYDRFFPSQDSIPEKGFGNLIALPLQREPRRTGNSVFVDDQFMPFADQWDFLGHLQPITNEYVQNVIVTFRTPLKQHIDKAVEPDTSIADTCLDDAKASIEQCFSGAVEISYSRHIAIKLTGLPSKLISRLRRLATFANPKFFKNQRMRKSTWNIPRYISCAELISNRICLPRGLLGASSDILKTAGAQVDIVDNRKRAYALLPITFTGELQPEQSRSLDALLGNGSGVLVAPPGSGKTVIGCALIGEIKLPTLILVHRKQLAEQWRSQLIKFLSIDKKSIGTYGPDCEKRTGIIDIGMIQTFARISGSESVLSDYGVVIIDECHHVPAPSFEPALRNISALYFFGLTATPYRKDGLQAIIHMQCGPIVYTMKESEEQKDIDRKVIIRETSFRMPPESPPQPPIHEIWNYLVMDDNRLQQIVSDVIKSLRDRQFPLILSDRRDHLEALYNSISQNTAELKAKGFLLTSGMGKRAMKKLLAEIQEMLVQGELPFILSTGSLIGEGFDLPELSALFLAMPISFKGRIVQYAGRMHRTSGKKDSVWIYDYVDSNLGLGISMFRKRVPTYKKMGYSIQIDDGSRLSELVNKRRHRSNPATMKLTS